MATTRVDLTDGNPIDLVFVDGSVLRLCWDAADGGVNVRAETIGSTLAQGLIVRPRTSNGVMLKATLSP